MRVITKIIFGLGAINRTGEIIKDKGISKVLITTDSNIIDARLHDPLVRSLEKKGIQYKIFDGVQENPSESVVEAATKALKENSCEAVLGLGGGSSIDTAKLSALSAKNPGSLLKYEGADMYEKLPETVIAIPTTAGTGSEVSQSAIITDQLNKRKISIRGKDIAPKIAILDPELLMTVPLRLAASTGMDAFAHAIEAFQSTAATPLSDLCAIKALDLISQNIRPFVYNRENKQAAKAMSMGAMLAGIAFANGRVGLPHAMSLPLTARYNIPHGTACAVLLAKCVKHSWKANPRRFAIIAKVIGEKVHSLSLTERAQKAANAIQQLCHDLDIPENFKEWNIPSSAVIQMSKDVLSSKIHETNCMKVGYEEIAFIYSELI